MRVQVILAAVLAAMTVGAAYAAAPPDADPALGPWFNNLHQNTESTYPGATTGYSCCGVDRDCRFVQWERRPAPAGEPPGRFKDYHYWAKIQVGPNSMDNFDNSPGGIGHTVLPGWAEVPDKVVLVKHDNPTGRAVACLTADWDAPRHIRWYCFVEGPEI